MNAICHFVPNAASFIRRCFLLIALIIPFLVAVQPSPANAISEDDAVEAAVEAAARGGQFLGFSIPEDGKELLKELVKCGVKGTPLTDCAKESLINILLKGVPDEAKKIVGCLLGGGDVLACATAAGLDNLPPQAKPVIECMLKGGTVAACAGQLALGSALAQVPPEARKVLECIANGGNPAACGAQALANTLPAGPAKDVANCLANGGSYQDCAKLGGLPIDPGMQQAAQETIDKLKQMKADADQALEDQKGTVKSIIEIAKGIKEEDWAKVTYYGGKELAKIVLTVIVEIVCPPCALIAGPVVAALVDLYGGLAEDLFKAATGGDVGAVPEIVFKFYFTEMITRPCALIPDGGFKDATCGNLAKVIAAAADVFGKAADFALDLAKKALEAVGIWQVGEAIVGVLEDVWNELFGDDLKDPKECKSPTDFYAKNYLACLGAVVGGSRDMMSTLHGKCDAQFRPCYGDKAAGICNGFDKALSDQAGPINAALEEGGRNYSPAIGAFIFSRRAQICANNQIDSINNFKNQYLNEFQKQCEDALGKNVALQVGSCPHKPAGMVRPPGPSLACSKAVAASGWQTLVTNTCDAWCRADPNNCPPSPPPCWVFGNGIKGSYGYTYRFGALDRPLCWMAWEKFSNRWDKYINPAREMPDILGPVAKNYHEIWKILANPELRDPVWSAVRIPAVFQQTVAPATALGSCKASGAMFSPVAEWTPGQTVMTAFSKSPTFSALVNEAPPPPMQRLMVSVQSVALIGGFDSCSGTGLLASPSRTGSDGSFTPRGSGTVTRTERARLGP